jgi:hypothetical protein
MDIVAAQWASMPRSLDSQATTGDLVNAVPISAVVFEFIEKLVQDHLQTRQTPRQKTKALFDYLVPEVRERYGFTSASVDENVEVAEWFMQRVHNQTKVDAEHDLDEYRAKFGVFERLLFALSEDFFQIIGELDEILQETNR